MGGWLGLNDHFFGNLKEASDHVLNVISRFIGVNTLCVASNDKETSDIFSAFHRHDVLLEAGVKLPFLEAY